MQKTASFTNAMDRGTAAVSTTKSTRHSLIPTRLSRVIRLSNVVAQAHRGSNWDGRQSSYQRRRGCDPQAWGFNGPLQWGFNGSTQGVTLEDLARQFGFSINMAGDRKNNDTASNWAGQASLPVDFEEKDGVYTIIADVPGLDKADLKITVNKGDRTLTISGERKRAEEISDEVSLKRRFERRMGSFHRTIPGLPENADLAAVSARVDKGVLAITIRKLPEVEQPDDSVTVAID